MTKELFFFFVLTLISIQHLRFATVKSKESK